MFGKKIIISGGGEALLSQITYVARLNQTGEDNPTIEAELKTDGASRAFTRTDAGTILFVFAGAFSGNQRPRVQMPTAMVGDEFHADVRIIDDNSAEIGIYDIGGNRIDGFQNLWFTIES